MVKGFIAGVLISLLCVVGYFQLDCRSLEGHYNLPTPVAEYLYDLQASCHAISPRSRDLYQGFYNRSLSFFQATSSGKQGNESFAKIRKQYAEETYEFIRVVYLPSFEPYWYFNILSVESVEDSSAILEVRILDPGKTVVDKDEDVSSYSVILDHYFEDSDSVRTRYGSLKETYDKLMIFREKDRFYNWGVDGVSYDVEVLIDGKWKHIHRSSADEAGVEDFAYVEAMMNLVKTEIPELAPKLDELVAKAKRDQDLLSSLKREE